MLFQVLRAASVCAVLLTCGVNDQAEAYSFNGSGVRGDGDSRDAGNYYYNFIIDNGKISLSYYSSQSCGAYDCGGRDIEKSIYLSGDGSLLTSSLIEEQAKYYDDETGKLVYIPQYDHFSFNATFSLPGAYLYYYNYVTDGVGNVYADDELQLKTNYYGTISLDFDRGDITSNPYYGTNQYYGAGSLFFQTDFPSPLQSDGGPVNYLSADLPAVPLPSSAPMFGAALLALGAAGFVFKRKKPFAAA